MIDQIEKIQSIDEDKTIGFIRKWAQQRQRSFLYIRIFSFFYE